MNSLDDVLPPILPSQPPAYDLARHLPSGAALGWLMKGWDDLRDNPLPSLAYGAAVFLISIGLVGGLFRLGLDYFLFPALAGFMIVAPVIATGLYEKSRRRAEGQRVDLAYMILVQARSGLQIFFIGVLLCLLLTLWFRSAVLIYALFFGVLPFPGLDHVASMLFGTATGWWMLLVGTLIGGLFAAFSFAVSVFSVPMLLNERLDAFTAMGTSIRLVWNNRRPMIAWGAIVLVILVLALIPGMIGLILAFPLLGHATWHAYIAIRQP
ncbi:DUF2189 domain-containing protein [Nitrospirillum bahiense]|uniref:Putative membrane protein n=1 Tax=Nitrospirillum amazonense TaxID=28077 RepID=A0A560FTL8_9PROT|nr:DUF2189 domain-containing protein [Nitrospirillum amazonense]TWB24976.1 putative membrane protein [Nitrospirillum amazonense]